MRGELVGGPLVELAGVAVVAVAIVFEGQAEQGAGVIFVGGDGPLQEGDDFVRVAAQGGDRRGALVQVFGRLLDGTRQGVERIERGLRLAGVALGFGLGEDHGVAGVAGLFGRLVGGERIVVLVEREVGLAEVEVRERAAVAVRERVDGVAVAAQQVVADAKPGVHRRAAVRLGLELGDRVAEVAVAGVVVGDGAGDLVDLARAEGRGGDDQLFQVGFEADTHGLNSVGETISC